MTAAYSLDLRERIVQLKLTGQYTNKEIAEIFMIGITSVKKYYRLHINNQTLEPQKPSGRIPTIDDYDKALLRGYVKSTPDATLTEYRNQLANDTGKMVTIQCIHYVLQDLHIAYKKKPICTRTRS